MNARRILFPTDFSTLSDAALEHAATLAKERGAELLIVHVAEPPAAYGGGEMYYGLANPDTPELKRMLQAVVPSDPQVPCEHRLLSGDPAEEIARIAEEEQVELVVMGTHGRTGFKRLLMGSVAEAVVRRAKVPVLTLKAPAAKHARAGAPVGT
jgi:nucleotide-binding universal stress UspA family protein